MQVKSTNIKDIFDIMFKLTIYQQKTMIHILSVLNFFYYYRPEHITDKRCFHVVDRGVPYGKKDKYLTLKTIQ